MADAVAKRRDGGVNAPSLDDATLAALAEARHANPFEILGPHDSPQGRYLRVYLPGAQAVQALSRADGALIGELDCLQMPGLFVGDLHREGAYLLRITWPDAVTVTEDSYAFGLLTGDLDLHLIAQGNHLKLAHCLGAHWMLVEGVAGVRFAVWAPNARRVAIVGDFNGWDERRHAMRLRHGAGVWELFVPRTGAGERYKFAILAADGTPLPLKADPMALATECPSANASVVAPPLDYAWKDAAWMGTRAARHKPDAPISIYEVHLGSWMRAQGEAPTWQMAIDRLIPYVTMLGFTHIELLPIAEHPFTGSWGYQPVSLFAPSARYGSAKDFARFVDACHDAAIGIIVDWVPGHFPDDSHGLARFDGTALYEHEDPREGLHPDWNTLIYNFGRREVRGFLAASALHWLTEFHLDGLRVDAVASMLYRDYGRREGAWQTNIHGGRENLEAVDFLRHVNAMVAEHAPGAMMIAEESTSWPGVTADIPSGGLGFSYKWSMGWMNDTLRYMAREPVHRRWHHDEVTFALAYAWSERFVLPLSHDEVVHGKGSLLGKMPGDEWQKFAQLRAYLAFAFMHPGKKLLFMGGEFGQSREWNHDTQLDWGLIEQPAHAGLLALTRELNHLYRREAALHQKDASPDGFAWLVVDDCDNSVFAWRRSGDENSATIIVVVNMTPLPRRGYRVGVPQAGIWSEILNTDSQVYGGSNAGNLGGAMTQSEPAHGEQQCLELYLPPLATIVLRHTAAP